MLSELSKIFVSPPLALITSLTLAACGGGTGDANSTQKPLAEAQPNAQIAGASDAADGSAAQPGEAASSAPAAASSAQLPIATDGSGPPSATPASAVRSAASAASAATGAPLAKTGAAARTGTLAAGSATPGNTGASGMSSTVASNSSSTAGPATATGSAVTAAAALATPATAAATQPRMAKTQAATSANMLADTGSGVPALIIYVEPTGNDAYSGASLTPTGVDGPVKTLARAQQLARTRLAAMLAGTVARAPVRVLIGPGEYNLSSAMNFSPLDSGAAGAPMSYEARVPASVLLSGGISLGSKTAPSSATSVSFAAPADAAAMAGGSQLYVNGRRAILARQPNAGAAWFVQRAVVLATEPAATAGSEAFAPAATDLAWIAKLDAADKKRAIVDVMQSWTDGRHRISTDSAPAGALRVTPKTRWPFMFFGVSQRYFVENVAAALDAPGEWIYDNAALRYIRRSDEAGLQIAPTLPVTERLLTVQGDATRNVQYLQFSGLNFAYSRYLTPDAGATDGQAATGIGAAIEVSKARNIVFDACSVQHTGGWGIWLRDSVRNSSVSNSTFSDLGAGGIKVGLVNQAASDANATGANALTGNTVAETGKLFPGATAIWLGQTWDNSISKNTIYNTSYSGISLGWSWGYAEPSSGRNTVRGNLLYNIGQRQMADIAAIYTLGRSPGTVVSQNIIRSVRGYTGYGAGAWGIYGDEGTSNAVFDGNVVLGTDSGGFHIHYGKDNVVKGNLLAGGDTAEIRVTRLDTGTNLTVQGNLFAPKVLQPFDQFAQAPGIAFTVNEVTPTLSGTGLQLAKCGSGCTLVSTAIQSTTSPTDIRSNSAAWSAVIASAVAAWAPVPSSDAQLAKQTAAPALPPVADAPTALVAPAIDFVADIAGTALGARPVGLTYLPKDNTAAIRVEAQADAANGKCLAFNDSASYVNRFEPYAFATLNYTSGSTTVEFDLKIDASTVLLHEWRDNASPYLSGPSISITPAGVAVAGKVVAPVSVGIWTKYRITAQTGAAATWKLELIRADGQRSVVDGLAYKSAAWRKLSWLGFISDAAVSSRPCFASIKASNLAP